MSNLSNVFDLVFEKSDFSQKELLSIFEETINEKINYNTISSYREIIFPKEDITRVLNKKGEFVYLQTSGTGYTQWILYHSENNNIVFILRTPGLTWNWTWRNLIYQEFLEINKTSTFSKL